MTLTVLLSAQLATVDGAGEGLAALLPVAGLTLIERQAEDAAAIGASAALILVDALPPALVAAVDRMRARGLPVTVVRDGPAVMAAAAGAARMLLVADGLVAPRSLWQAVTAAAAPRLLAVSDTPSTAALERIDAQRRWAGLAIVDAGAISALGELPPDWDPQLALLRGAIQAEAPSIMCEPQLFERGDVALLDRAVAADVVEQRMLARGSDVVVGLVHANVAMPLARAGARWLLRGQQGGVVARTLALAGAAAAGAAMLAGYPALAVMAALVGVLAQAAAATIAAFRPETGVPRLLGQLATPAFAAALLLAAWAAAVSYRAHAWLWLLTGLSMLLVVALGRMLAARKAARPGLVWDDGALWLLLGAGVLAGSWLIAFVAAVPLALAAALFAIWKSEAANSV